ncbi:PQQ-binding-like beta-propeller repeat protein [Pollutibacter soli]|uniref:outer membrane protein assembly factor BamB family protein n=1 Tax=Pollutibacter soli TaxID=3034157 RepID=UPI0030140C45
MQPTRIGFTKLTFMFALIGMMACKSNESERSWSVYKGDERSSSYSSLNQINAANVSQLKQVWTFEMNDLPASAQAANNQCNPIIVDGIMYAISPKRSVFAIEAATGKQIWAYDFFNGGGGGGVNRGVTYWDKRIIYAAGSFLVALDATNGKPITSFGDSGKVNLNEGVRDDPEKIAVTLTTPGIIFNDLIIIGSRLPDLYGTPPGYVRAYNCKTGALVWTFHTIPLPGEAGYDTWPKDAYKYAGGVNNWSGMAVDTKRGMVFMSLGSPTYDFYGADRIGQNLYGNCVLALDAATGTHKWHYQTVHHDIWDYDLPSPPNLVQLEKDGKTIDAVAQVSKQGFIYILDRETGQPVFPIEERAVPASNLPGEQAWPTQPFPTKPAPFARQLISENDLSHFSDSGHEAVLKKFRSMRYEGIYTPPDLKGTLMFPGTRGGANWGGAAFDETTNTLYVRSSEAPDIQTIIEVDPNAVADMPIIDQGRRMYAVYCASCHGANKVSNTPTYPSLTDLNKRMSREAALDKIQKGGGLMPPFAGVLKEDEQQAILAFVHSAGKTQDTAAKAKADTTEKKKLYLNTTGYATWKDPSGNPAIKAPWGRLHSLNLSTGEYNWQIPLGNDDKRQAAGEPETGQEGKAGPIVTAGGLIFIGGGDDKKFRALDKETGIVVWETVLPGITNATACTFSVKGKQYVSVCVSGTKEKPSGSIVTFSIN